MTPAAIEAAFREACAVDIRALKPGNVHVFAAGHGMSVDDFERSAEAAAAPLCRAGAPLGARILGAVAATRAAVGQNTNLGIVLLCAPLAMAAECGGGLRDGVRRVIAASDLEDAALAFRAIALASPGGLGEVPEHDVRRPATVALPVAMGAAAGRDSVARQWATGFAEVFETGLPSFRHALARWGDVEWAATRVFLDLLARVPDSHIGRKSGAGIAETVRAEAAVLFGEWDDAADPAVLAPRLLAWDASLKTRGLNPGTSADLTVATLFVARLCNGLRGLGFGG